MSNIGPYIVMIGVLAMAMLLFKLLFMQFRKDNTEYFLLGDDAVESYLEYGITHVIKHYTIMEDFQLLKLDFDSNKFKTFVEVQKYYRIAKITKEDYFFLYHV